MGETSISKCAVLNEARKLVRDGTDPLAERDATRIAAEVAKVRAITFGEATDRYVAAHQAGWRSARHSADWRASLAANVLPVIGKLPVGAVDTSMVLQSSNRSGRPRQRRPREYAAGSRKSCPLQSRMAGATGQTRRFGAPICN